MSNGVARLLDRLKDFSEEEQDRLAEEFLMQIDEEDDFDRLIASRPDVLRRMADEAWAEHEAGLTAPLTRDDFALSSDS